MSQQQTTIQSNTITENQNGVVVEDGASPELLCNIIWGNNGGVSIPWISRSSSGSRSRVPWLVPPCQAKYANVSIH